MTTKLRERSEAWIKQFTGSKPEIAELLDIHVDALDLLDEMAACLAEARVWVEYDPGEKFGKRCDAVLAKYEGKS